MAQQGSGSASQPASPMTQQDSGSATQQVSPMIQQTSGSASLGGQLGWLFFCLYMLSYIVI
jgi:hypothetical protein